MSGAAALAVAATTGAVVLLLPGAPPAPPARGGPLGRVLVAVPAAGVVVVLSGHPRLALLGVVVLAASLGAVRLLRGRAEAHRADANRARAVELCDALRSEIAAGQAPEHALGRAAEEWPLVAPAARAAASGGDVPLALRELAAEPGSASLRVVAAAWQVAHRTGHGLADALGRVADDLRAAEQTRRVVTGELASARATARLLAVLPLAALAMGSGAGASPWSFLLGTPAGLACLVVGLALGYAGLAWVEALARDVDGSG